MNEKKEISTIDELLGVVKSYIHNEDEITTIIKAYDYASEIHKGNKRLSGEDYILHPLNVAYILTSLYADSDTIATALLHDVIHKGNGNLLDIKNEFGDEIAEACLENGAYLPHQCLHLCLHILARHLTAIAHLLIYLRKADVQLVVGQCGLIHALDEY